MSAIRQAKTRCATVCILFAQMLIAFSLFFAGCSQEEGPPLGAGRPSHFVPRATAYYLSAPMPGQKADGTFPAKSKFRMIEEGEQYSLVQIVGEDWVQAYVATKELQLRVDNEGEDD